MPQYLIYFNQQWVGDHDEAWFESRVAPSTAVVREMRDQGVLVYAGGLVEELEEAADLLSQAVGRLRDHDIEVVVAPAPDLSTTPRVPSFLRGAVRAASMRIRRAQVAAASSAGAVVADADGRTSELFRTDPSLFSADHFHPSGAGYAVIAGELFPHVLAAAELVTGQGAHHD
jgi:hypothetical protein